MRCGELISGCPTSTSRAAQRSVVMGAGIVADHQLNLLTRYATGDGLALRLVILIFVHTPRPGPGSQRQSHAPGAPDGTAGLFLAVPTDDLGDLPTGAAYFLLPATHSKDATPVTERRAVTPGMMACSTVNVVAEHPYDGDHEQQDNDHLVKGAGFRNRRSQPLAFPPIYRSRGPRLFLCDAWLQPRSTELATI